MMDRVNHMDVKFIWGNSNYQYVSSDSAGSSGGILCVWETTIFKKDYATVSDYFIAIYGTWISNNSKSSSRLFNHFITSSGLVDVKLEGYSFTWAHHSATKMSKLDHFRVSKARDYVQKSKIKWAIEGDENSKFFHGIINKKRSQLSIRRDFVDGDWNTDPEVVKDVFKYHFATRFKQPAHGRLKLNISFPNRLSTDQVADMDRSVPRDEIRVAVWNCGENKSPGPDGGSFPKGSNSSFIALIPKVTDAKFVTDFRPISLIGCVYKVVTNILANRVMVEDNMSRKLTWADTVQKLRFRLSKWKVKTLFIGVLASEKNGGLGVSSFHALNRALLLKWVWCFLSQDGSIWYRVIQALYGASFELHPVNQSSFWCSILREMQVLISKGFDFVSHYKKSTVASKLESSSVDASFRVSVRDGVERQQWDDLNSVSGSVTLSASK
nr:RNA-directed DNA polymerase, eukaryota [Tanacetum cinerariifolium]